jgi:hypothetical protein
MDEEKRLIKHLQKANKNNCIIKIAVAAKRDYVTPEDIEEALKIADPNTVMRDALALLGDNTGYGVEDRRLFAQLAAQV